MKLFEIAKLAFVANLISFVVSIKEIAPRIVGGSYAKPGEFPYQAFLLMVKSNDDGYTCGGSVLSERWIITTAHCLDGYVEIYVILGSTNVDFDNLESTAQTFHVTNVSNMIKHPKYIGSGYSFDIGLLKLNKNIKFNDFVKAIKLPPRGHLLYENCTAIATGWGKLSDSNPKSKKLQFVPLKVTNTKECDTFYRKTFGLEILCTSTKGKKSTCSGDSGGPLVYYNQVLIGISAFVPTFIFNIPACSSEKPAGFTRVSYYLDWIGNVTGIQA